MFRNGTAIQNIVVVTTVKALRKKYAAYLYLFTVSQVATERVVLV